MGMDIVVCTRVVVDKSPPSRSKVGCLLDDGAKRRPLLDGQAKKRRYDRKAHRRRRRPARGFGDASRAVCLALRAFDASRKSSKLRARHGPRSALTPSRADARGRGGSSGPNDERRARLPTAATRRSSVAAARCYRRRSPSSLVVVVAHRRRFVARALKLQVRPRLITALRAAVAVAVARRGAMTSVSAIERAFRAPSSPFSRSAD